MTKKKTSRPDPTEKVTRIDGANGQQGPEDEKLPQHQGDWGGEPVMEEGLKVKSGEAAGSYKQPMKEYITPAAHYVERFGQMNAGRFPYHPYTLAVGMVAVRDFFLSSGLSEIEATTLSKECFDIHVKSGKLLDTARAEVATELSKKGEHIDEWAARKEAIAMERLQAMEAKGHTAEEPAVLDFDALEELIPEPENVPSFPDAPMVQDTMVDPEVMAKP